MQTAARISNRIGQALFDIHMNIFELHAEFKCAALDLRENLTQPIIDCRALFLREDSNLCEHGCVCKRPRNILAVHPTVECDGRLKLVDHLVRRLGEASAPELFAHLFCPSCIRARTLSGSPKRLMNPVASAWL